MANPNALFLTEEWAQLKNRIKEDITKQMNSLERASDTREMFQAQGALKALRALLNIEKTQPNT
jgi:hypothetical protein